MGEKIGIYLFIKLFEKKGLLHFNWFTTKSLEIKHSCIQIWKDISPAIQFSVKYLAI